MSDLIRLEDVDVDGALRDAAQVAGDTRMDFFKKAAVGGGTVLASGALMGGLPSLALGAKRSKANDVKILQFALTLEYLEAAFYNEAVATRSISTDSLNTAKVVRAHENTHVKALKKALGKAAPKKPKFDFGDTTSDDAKFLATAQALEDTGVAAYAGQAPNIKQPAVLAVAASILTVEARHASRFRSLNGANFAPAAFDKAKTKKQVLAAVKKTGFITS